MVRTTFSGRPLFRLVALVACAIFCQGAYTGAAAQAPTPDQIEIFRNLPPDQQQAILESMNRGGSTSNARGVGGVLTDRKLQFPQTVQPRGREKADDEEEEFDERGMPKELRLKGNDTVLLSLEIRRFERRAPEIEERERREQQQQQSTPVQPLIPGRQVQETGKDAGSALTVGQSLLANLRDARPVGRLVIDLKRASMASPGSEQDIVLKHGDRLLVPRVTQEVTVIGEVQSATSHLLSRGRVAGRLHSDERWPDSACRRRPYLRRTGRRQRGDALGRCVVQRRRRRYQDRRYDRCAARYRTHAAAAVLDSGDHDHLQLGHIRGGGKLVLIALP